MLDRQAVEELQQIVGSGHVFQDADTLSEYSADALRQPGTADVVVLPKTTDEVAAIARLCNRRRFPLTPRGGGTGYSGGAVPLANGVVLALDRMNRILSIEPENLLAVVQPNVFTAELQRAVAGKNLFYPPDPASADRCAIGGNVAENAGGPRAFKYGTTARYILGLEAVLPTGSIIRTGGKTLKNVAGYDLTHLIVGSEGTLAIVTEVTVRLIPKPLTNRTLCVGFQNIPHAIGLVSAVIANGITPSSIELIDEACLDCLADIDKVRFRLGDSGALLLLEVDGTEQGTSEDALMLESLCREHEATSIVVAVDDSTRDEIWSIRKNLSLILRAKAPLKINHDVVVPISNIPSLFEAISKIRSKTRLDIACFGHVGDGNIHVNILVNPANTLVMDQARQVEEDLFKTVVDLNGSISGEHGIGYTKAKYLPLQLTDETIETMQAIKRAFDPHGILNPGKIFDAK